MSRHDVMDDFCTRLKRYELLHGCELKIKIPTDHTKDEDAIRNALLEKLPGVRPRKDKRGVDLISDAR